MFIVLSLSPFIIVSVVSIRSIRHSAGPRLRRLPPDVCERATEIDLGGRRVRRIALHDAAIFRRVGAPARLTRLGPHFVPDPWEQLFPKLFPLADLAGLSRVPVYKVSNVCPRQP
jgi:hypothetical protein